MNVLELPFKVENREKDARAGTVRPLSQGVWEAFSDSSLVTYEGEPRAVRYIVRRVARDWRCNCQSRTLCWHVRLPLREALTGAGWRTVQFRQSLDEAKRQHGRVIPYFRNNVPFYAIVRGRPLLPDRVTLRYKVSNLRGMGFEKLELSVQMGDGPFRRAKEGSDWVRVTEWLHEHGYVLDGRRSVNSAANKTSWEVWRLE